MMLKYFQALMQGRFHSSICYSVPNSWCTNSKKREREKKKKEGEKNGEKSDRNGERRKEKEKRSK